MKSTRQDESGKAVQVFSYKVIDGRYHPTTPQSGKAAGNYHLRQADELRSFPFAAMLEKARANPGGGPFCTTSKKD